MDQFLLDFWPKQTDGKLNNLQPTENAKKQKSVNQQKSGIPDIVASNIYIF